MVVLFYLMLAMPFQTAFEEGLETSEVKTMNDIDMGITCLFVLDILLNFRTGYLQNYIEILDTRRVAMRYLRTWAPLDIISTMPFEQMMGSGEQLAAIRVFKIGKLFRVFKIIALSARAASSLGESLDEFSAEYKLTSIRRRWGVLSVLFISAHWLACGLKLFGSPGLTGYQDVAGSGWREYLAGLYWAITTLTTVGYGDITPNSDGGRLYCMVSMVLGGAFYGYIVGSISSIVANRDLNSNHYDECMDLSNAWMTHHKFPRPLRVKVRRYFKEYFAEQCAHDDSEAYGQLSTALQDEVCEYLFAEDLRAHPMFDGVSSSVIMQMNKIMHKFKVQEGELITKAGDPGLAMYVILDGTVSLEHSEGDGKKMLMTKGDSFDEEILFGRVEWCTYTAIATSDSEIQMITEEGFVDCFKSMPKVVDVLLQNMLRFNERRQHTFE